MGFNCACGKHKMEFTKEELIQMHIEMQGKEEDDLQDVIERMRERKKNEKR